MTKNEREAMVHWREYLAGPCDEHCPPGKSGANYDGHKHYTPWYENNRATVVALNYLLQGELLHFDLLYKMKPTLEEANET